MSDDTPDLVRTPIVEVVCGIRFKPILAFDTLRHGLYWSRIRERFPGSEVHPFVTDPGSRIVSDVPLQRSWFVSADKQFVVQIQVDRFILNWRRRGPNYPSFADVYERFSHELDGFRLFMRDILDTAPEVIGFELSKVDVLEHPTDWVDRDDLARMIPRLRSVVAGTGPLNINVATAQGIEGEGVLNIGYRTVPLPNQNLRVQADFRMSGPLPDGLELDAAFTRANSRLNDAFFTELPDAEQRFGTRIQ